MTSSTTTPTKLSVSPRRFYRIVSIAEAVTWTLLITGMVLKYGFHLDIAVLIGGSIHGLVFVTYAGTALLVGVNQRWRPRLVVGAVLTAIVPYATIPFDRWLEKRDLLEGDWRTEATDDPRDHTWIGRLLRWMLNHPTVLVAVFIVVVLAIVTILLIVGPPGGWK